MNDFRVFILIIVMAFVTMAIRFFPFIVFKGKKTPEVITYLSKYLPYPIIAMLVVYCLKGISVTEKPYGAPEFIGVFIVAALHVWKRNTLLSIVAGTVIYMLLKQMVFG